MEEIKKAVISEDITRQKIPIKGRIGRRKMKKRWCTVLYVSSNKVVDFVKAPIEDNTVKVGELIHEATPDDILIFRGKPMLIIPEWAEKPMRPWRAQEHYEETEKMGGLTTTQRHILSKLEQGIIKGKKKFSAMGWIILVAVVLGVIYFISQGGLSGG